MKRRTFIQTVGTAGLVMNIPLLQSCSHSDTQLDLLVLGGTHFVGPAIVHAALNNGHKVTLFNRGVSNPDLFRELPFIEGDRDHGRLAYTPLKSKKWDAIVDVWPEKSNLVDDATLELQNQTDHYVFISSIAVYNDFQEVGLHERSDVITLPTDQAEWYYSEEKLAAEQFVSDRFASNHTILRPGPIKGWRDPALDLLYWCLKINEEKAVIAPGTGTDPIQFIDANDVGRFAIGAIESKFTGTYNVTGPGAGQLLWKDFLSTVKRHFQSDTELKWASEEFLQNEKISSFTDLPLWAPISEDRGFMQISNRKLVESGFEFTPLTKTLDDVMKWYSTEYQKEIAFGTEEIGIGLSREKEQELLQRI